MAYTISENQSNTVFSLTKNIVKMLQVIFMFYAFLSLVYWILYSANVKGIEDYFWIFKPTWDFINIFYTYKPSINNETIDFTGVISSIFLIIFSNSFKSIYDIVETAEQKYKIALNRQIERQNRQVNKNLSATKQTPKSTTGFIFLLEVQITNLANFIQEENLSPEAIETLKEKFYKALLDNLNQNQISQKGRYKKKLLLVYKDFNYIDDFIFYTRETLNSLSREFYKPSIKIDFLVSISRLTPTDNINEEVSILDTIICLGIKNEFICTTAFKMNYDEKAKKQYKLITKGIYNLSRNLNLTNNQEIFTLKDF